MEVALSRAMTAIGDLDRVDCWMRAVAGTLLAFGLIGCGASTSPCQLAAEHVASCLGETTGTTTGSCDADGAASILAQSCEQITGASGKFDNVITSLICRITGHFCPTPSASIPPLKYGEASADQIAAEASEFEGYAMQIQQVQRNNQQVHGGAIDRGFHQKTHICVQGQLDVDPNRPDFAQFGVFAQMRSYPIWIRFSNSVGYSQSDALPDTRGMAIKVQGADGYAAVQDFLGSTAPTQLFPDAKGAMEYALMNSDPDPLVYPKYLADNPSIALGVAKYATTFPLITTSLVNQDFWSSSVISLGPRAVKFNYQPCQDKVPLDFLTSEYLSDDLKARLAQQSICYNFRVQFQADTGSTVATPIEDASAAWTTPFYVVGKITIPQKSSSDIEEESAACASMSFSPWNTLAEHTPLGNTNRARKAIYEASRANRQGH